jgi:spore coat polysaccharide biosynthesis protein SpsF
MSSASGSWTSPKAVVTIEARMTSSRLPGKVMADVGGRPLLELMIGRLQRAQLIDAICVATTINDADDDIEALATRLGVGCHRGSEDDVLARVLDAALASEADLIVETTGDCPMIDPSIVDACILAFLAEPVDYCANNLERSFPRGLDTQVFPTGVLADVAKRTSDPADREHVSLYIYEHPELYRLRTVRATGRLRRPDLRWTVDTADDLALVRAVVVALGPDFTSAEAIRFLDANPEIVALNAHVEQKPVR